MRRKRADKVRIPKIRHRSLGELRSLNVRAFGGTQGKPLEYDVTFPSVTTTGNLKEMTDVVTPGFSSAIANGHRINNPMSAEVRTPTPWNSTYTRTWTKSNGVGFETVTGPVVASTFGSLPDSLPPIPFNTDNVNRIATLDVWNKVEPAKSQTLVTVFEAHKTWDTVYDRAKKLAKIVEACRRKDVKALSRMLSGSKRAPHPKAFVLWDEDGQPLLTKRGKSLKRFGHQRFTSDRKYLDEASSLWLEYRYGWSPLVYDIIDSLKAVYAADLRNDLLPRDLYRAYGQAQNEEVVSSSITGSFGGLAYTGNRVSHWRYVVKAYIHYRWSAPDGVVRRMNDFGLFDVPRAVWELVPFSFVADWIIPIGDYLGALTPKIGVEYADMGHTYELSVHAEQALTGPSSQVSGGITYPSVVPVGSSDRYDYTRRERKTFVGIPVYPPIDVKLGIKRMADAASLFKRMR